MYVWHNISKLNPTESNVFIYRSVNISPYPFTYELGNFNYYVMYHESYGILIFFHRNGYSPTETLVEFDFGCKSMFVTCKIEFYAAAIILLINANEGCQFGVRNVSFRQGCYR
jgi:hypothetical protein